MRRIPSTCEVSAVGGELRRCDVDGPFEGRQDVAFDDVYRPGNGEARGVRVTAAAPACGNGAYIHARLGAQTDAAGSVLLNLEERDRRDLIRAERQVHQAFSVVHGGAAFRKQRVIEFE